MKAPLFALGTLLLGLSFAVATISANEQPTKSKQLALDGLRTWAAFKATVFASVAEDGVLQERLATVALNSGRRFLNAYMKNEIAKEDIENTVPSVVLLNAQGPSVDFILGRIYAAAEEEAFKKFRTEDGRHITDLLIKKNIAREELRRSNAELLAAQKLD